MGWEAQEMIRQREYDMYCEPAEESWTDKCPHGYDVEHDKCNIPGFRSHDTWTDCPYCRWDRDPFGFIQDTANKHNTRQVSQHGQTLELTYPWRGARRKELTQVDTYNLNEEMFKKMRHDQEQIAWFKDQGICEGKWTEKMNAAWWKWVSDCWLSRGGE